MYSVTVSVDQTCRLQASSIVRGGAIFVLFIPDRSRVDYIYNGNDLERLEKFARDKITLDK